MDIYARYAKFHNIHFSEPRYARTDTLPFVPLQQELETLINDTRNLRHVALLRLLFETGMRVGEASQSRFKDYDFEKRAVRVLPEKGSRTRELRLSEKACSMLRDVYSKYPKGPLPAPRTARRYLERTRTFLARTKQ